jgi:hypothetical protein
MRRAKKLTGTGYIDSRIAQLKSDRDLSTNSADVMWYNRTMQELDWAKQAITGNYSDQCVLERTA